MKTNFSGLKMHTEIYFLAFVLFLHILLRAKSAFLDLPPLSFFDEVLYAQNAYGMFLDGNLIPPKQSLAGGFTYYVCFFATKFYSLFFGRNITVEQSVVLSRSALILVSCLMPLFVYKSLKLLEVNGAVAILAAAISSFSPLSLALTRVVYPDHFMPGLMAALTYFVIKFIKNDGHIKHLVVPGVLLGFVFSTKYSGFLLIVPITILIFHGELGKNGALYSDIKQSLIKIFIVLGISAAIFTLLNISGLMAGDVLWAIESHRNHYKGGHLGAETEHGILFYSKILFLLSLGVLGMPLIIGGFILLWIKDRKLFLFFMMVIGLYLLTLGSYRVVFSRNISQLLPMVFILIGLSIGFCAAWLNKYFKFERKSALWVVGLPYLILLGAEPLARSFIQLRYDYRIDSRIAANHWLLKNTGLEDKIGFVHDVWGAPYVERKNKVAISLPSDPNKFKDVKFYVVDSWTSDYLEKGTSMFKFIPFSDHQFVNISQARYPDLIAGHKNFLKQFELLKEFSNEDHYGPSVYIYKRKD